MVATTSSGHDLGTLSQRLFENIAWSTPTVLKQTLERCRALDLDVELLEVIADIDTPADFEDLCRRLSRSNTQAHFEQALGTRALLEDWGKL